MCNEASTRVGFKGSVAEMIKDIYGGPCDALSKGVKYDEGKVRYDLIAPECELLLAKVLTEGLKKYPAHNWQKEEDLNNSYYSALRRHLEAWRMGEDADPDSGLPHLAHAYACMHFLLWQAINESGVIE